MKTNIIKIEKYEDYNECFAEKYIDKNIQNERRLKSEYAGDKFDFIIYMDSFKESDFASPNENFKKMINGILNIQHHKSFQEVIKNIIIIIQKDSVETYKAYVKSTNKTLENHFFYEITKNGEVIISIEELNDTRKDAIAIFLEAFCITDVSNNWIINEKYTNHKFYFLIDKKNIKVYSRNLIYLRKALLLSSKLNIDKNYINLLFDYAHTGYQEIDNESLYRLYAHLENYKDILYVLNNKIPVKYSAPKSQSSFKILPAIYINSELYEFFNKSISKDDWFKIVGIKEINITKKDNTKDLILHVCRRYLFDEFQENQSKQYTKLRKIAYLNPKFFDMIKNIPLLALFIFSQYDYFYRSELIKETKKFMHIKEFRENDIILNLQGQQQREHYKKYKMLSSKGTDIKTLIFWRGESEIISQLDRIVNACYDDLLEKIKDIIENIECDEKKIKKIFFHFICCKAFGNQFINFEDYANMLVLSCFKKKNFNLTGIKWNEVRRSNLVDESFADVKKYLNLISEDESKYSEAKITELFEVIRTKTDKINNLYCDKDKIEGLIKETLTTNLNLKEYEKKFRDYLKLINPNKDSLSKIDQELIRQTRVIDNILNEIQTLIKDVKYESLSKALTTIEYHQELISEMFESATIAECLLQIMENAVFYAQGGLLSITVNKYASEHDDNYLKEEYAEYFKQENTSKYYLEMDLTDISSKDLTTQFKENIKNRKRESDLSDESIEAYLKKEYEQVLDNLSLRSFFEPSNDERKMWAYYYQLAENQIHHYGLQIFSTIVALKKGIFLAQSFEDSFIQGLANSKLIPHGTSYHILLPLRQSTYKNDIGRDFSSVDDYSLNNYENPTLCCFAIQELNRLITTYKVEGKSNKEVISTVSEDMHKKFNECDDPKIICLSMQKDIYEENLEIIIKAMLLLTFKELDNHNEDKAFCLAITELSSLQFLESVRLFALFLNKNSLNVGIKNLQIFLRGERVGEEILLFGNNPTETIRQIKKTSMMRGTSFDSYEIVQKWLREENS